MCASGCEFSAETGPQLSRFYASEEANTDMQPEGTSWWRHAPRVRHSPPRARPLPRQAAAVPCAGFHACHVQRRTLASCNEEQAAGTARTNVPPDGRAQNIHCDNSVHSAQLRKLGGPVLCCSEPPCSVTALCKGLAGIPRTPPTDVRSTWAPRPERWERPLPADF